VFFKSTSRVSRAAATLFFTPLPYLLQLADQSWTALPACVLLFLMAAIAWDAFDERRMRTVPHFASEPGCRASGLLRKMRRRRECVEVESTNDP